MDPRACQGLFRAGPRPLPQRSRFGPRSSRSHPRIARTLPPRSRSLPRRSRPLAMPAPPAAERTCRRVALWAWACLNGEGNPCPRRAVASIGMPLGARVGMTLDSDKPCWCHPPRRATPLHGVQCTRPAWLNGYLEGIIYRYDVAFPVFVVCGRAYRLHGLRWE